MGKQLLNKFIRNYVWLLLEILVTVFAEARDYPVTDTCQNPAPPVITGSSKAICRSETVTLTATGCTGTVVWSNGETGPVIQVQPQQTTKYTAICRAKPGCISCFAEVWKITVNTPDAPTITQSAKLICPDDAVTLTATNCAGTIHWTTPEGLSATGSTWTGRIQQTTTFQAFCEQANCISNPSIPTSVQIAVPVTPVVSASKRESCAGQPIQITASGCIGTVRWNDGGNGITRTATPTQTTSYRAICQIGSCQSDSSEAVVVQILSANQPLNVITTLTNTCPFLTADLSKAIASRANPGLSAYYTFRTGPSLDAVAVQSPGAVGAGTYYVFGRDAQGCYTVPATINVAINPCANAIAPCLSNPPVVVALLDSLNWDKGVVKLKANLGGSASGISWQSSGDGLFTDTGLKARYLLSENDRQRGSTVFTLSAADPDGTGPCVGTTATITVSAPSREIVGLGKKVSEPVWVVDGSTRLVELTYLLTAANLGKHDLTNVQIADDLDAGFSGVGARIHSVQVRADSGLAVNSAYTGRGADTVLVTNGRLAVGKSSRIWLVVRVEVSQASTLTFSNKASIQAFDANGSICRDRSTNGTEVDPDQNGNPADNDEPTLVTLHSLQAEEGETVFIPEGFSPNNDGINDRFIIQRLPTGITVRLDIFNRWGQLVYQNNDYKNDWDGTANQGVKVADARQGLPDGTYYYQIRLSDGREFVRFLTLAR
jgi:gliding motility-associated-like protein